MPEAARRRLSFGTFELDPSSSELRNSGNPVKLQSQHFQLLTLLAERAGEVVTREEIRRTLWDGETFVDFDRSINFGVNQIRAALDDDPRSPRYVETLPRKGYRFIAPVTEVGPGALDDAGAEPPRLEPATPPKPSRRRLLFGVAAMVATAAAALLVAANVGGIRDRILERPALKPIQSLAVLPLENLSHDPEQEYFAEGMTDELITALAKISALRVLSRTSIVQYRGTKKTLPEIARELNVDAVVEGTVLRANNQVRITAQLIRASPEQHLWAEHYEGSLEQILTLQENVARAVANSIQVKLTPRENTLLGTARPVNAEAYEAYLKGHYFVRNRSEENLEKGRQYFQQAIDKDPGYAPAWAGLADCYGLLGSFGVLPRPEAAVHQKAAAEKALELDGSLAEALAKLAEVKVTYEWDWAGGEQLFKRAIELDPNNGSIHDNYAFYLTAVARHREAVAEQLRATEVEPFFTGWKVNLGWYSYFARQYDQAERVCNGLLEVNPKFSWNHGCLASVYLQTGRAQQAIPELRKALELGGHGIMELTYLAHDLAVTGERTEARELLAEMKGLSAKRYVPPENIAMVYQGLGDTDAAFQWLERAYKERSMHPWVYRDPRLDPIRSDPRFKSLMRGMGLAD